MTPWCAFDWAYGMISFSVADDAHFGANPPSSKSAQRAEAEVSASASSVGAGLSGRAWFGLELIPLLSAASGVGCAGLSGTDPWPDPFALVVDASTPPQGRVVAASPVAVGFELVRI